MVQAAAAVKVLVLSPSWRGVQHEESAILQRQFRWTLLEFIHHDSIDITGCLDLAKRVGAQAVVAPREFSSQRFAKAMGRCLLVEYLRGPSQVITW